MCVPWSITEIVIVCGGFLQIKFLLIRNKFNKTCMSCDPVQNVTCFFSNIVKCLYFWSFNPLWNVEHFLSPLNCRTPAFFWSWRSTHESCRILKIVILSAFEIPLPPLFFDRTLTYYVKIVYNFSTSVDFFHISVIENWIVFWIHNTVIEN